MRSSQNNEAITINQIVIITGVQNEKIELHITGDKPAKKNNFFRALLRSIAGWLKSL